MFHLHPKWHIERCKLFRQNWIKNWLKMFNFKFPRPCNSYVPNVSSMRSAYLFPSLFREWKERWLRRIRPRWPLSLLSQSFRSVRTAIAAAIRRWKRRRHRSPRAGVKLIGAQPTGELRRSRPSPIFVRGGEYYCRLERGYECKS